MGDDGPSDATDRVPDHAVRLVYGRLGFSARHTVILAYQAPYVTLATASRPRDPYSLVSLDTGRTVARFASPEAASARLAELSRSAGNASVGPSDPAERACHDRDAP